MSLSFNKNQHRSAGPCYRHPKRLTVAAPKHFLYFFPEPQGHGSRFARPGNVAA
jgi:hypothetical protein